MRIALAVLCASLGCGSRESERESGSPPAIAASLSLLPSLPNKVPIDLRIGTPGHPENSLVVPIKLGEIGTFEAKRTSFVGTAAAYTWMGTLGPHGTVLISGRGSHVTGTIFDGTQMLRIESKIGVGLVIRPARKRIGRIDKGETFRHGTKPPRKTLQGNIRILTAYTAAAAADPRCAPIEATIDHAIWQTNVVAIRSEVSPRFERAGEPYKTSFDEADHSLDVVVEDFVNDTDMHARRKANAADIVALFVSSSDVSLIGAAALTTADYAHAVVVVSCVDVNEFLVLPHEIGHLFGLNDDSDPPSENTIEYAYGSFHESPAQGDCWRTVMSDAVACACCARIPYWSNPAVEFNGVATGDKTKHDNARVIEDTAGAISRFEPPP